MHMHTNFFCFEIKNATKCEEKITLRHVVKNYFLELRSIAARITTVLIFGEVELLLLKKGPYISQVHLGSLEKSKVLTKVLLAKKQVKRV